MSKRTFLSALIVAVIISYSSSGIQAQSSLNQSNTSAKKNNENTFITDNVEELTTNNPNSVKKLTQYAEKLQKRFGIYHTRLTLLVEKIELQIDRLEQSGKDVKVAETQLDLAKTKLAQSDVTARQATELLRIDTSGNTQIRQLTQTTRQGYMETLQLLQQTVQLLKDAR